ncbi:MAG: penicillin-insensitive murein endopeptidase [Oligoflexia bacterium]|nr:penicillin-insensitive murein endopeptidase [Oligoflexia bacterium]
MIRWVYFVAVLAALAGCGPAPESFFVGNEMVGVPDRAGEGTRFPAKGLPELFSFVGEQAIGFYSEGSLVSPSAFPLEGEGFVKIQRPRNRSWGADELIGTMILAAREVARAYPVGERLQIADASAFSGGSLPGHASHQNGLDVDLVYYRQDHREQAADTSSGFEEDFVNTSTGAISPNFDLERNFALMRALVSSGWINRIFIDEALKAAFCRLSVAQDRFEEDTETLRRLRHWPKHGDHLHVRVKCPFTSPRCVAQDEPPPGPGC